MSERVREIEFKGRTMVYCDLSNTQGEEIKRITDEVDRRVMEKGTDDQLFLINVEDCVVDNAALQAFKASAFRLRPYLKASASFGVTGLKMIFMNAINKFSGINVTAHPTMREAQEYLVQQAEA
jgi:hypothetical protein